MAAQRSRLPVGRGDWRRSVADAVSWQTKRTKSFDVTKLNPFYTCVDRKAVANRNGFDLHLNLQHPHIWIRTTWSVSDKFSPHNWLNQLLFIPISCLFKMPQTSVFYKHSSLSAPLLYIHASHLTYSVHTDTICINPSKSYVTMFLSWSLKHNQLWNEVH